MNTRLALPRRRALQTLATGLGGLALARALPAAEPQPDYLGPNVILVRFGGGARPQECINADPNKNFAPFLKNVFAPRGTLYPRMFIDSFTPTVGVDTSHGQGTMYLITGKYEKLKGVSFDEDFRRRYPGTKPQPLDDRFESKVPTLFEYFRKAFRVPPRQTLIVNSEDRKSEEFYTYSTHLGYGVNYKSEVLSLYRFKTWLLRRNLAAGKFKDNELKEKQKQLAELEKIDFRREEAGGQIPELTAFWERWSCYYGDTGFVNPRGDRLLTELAIRAMRELRPKLMMVNYQDCDYVHWGIPAHYTRAVSIMDEGLKQLVEAVEANPEYRDNTIFVVVPDCGRDNNPLADVPFQHHFNSKAAHEIFAVLAGPGIAKGAVVDKSVDQIQVTGTIAKLMGFKAEQAESRVLEEAFA